VALRYKLEPFTAESTEAYVKHRLRLAGCPRLPFTPEALLAVHAHSGGTPRVINTLCDNALFEAFLAREEMVDEALIHRIGQNLGLQRGAGDGALAPPPGSEPAALPLAATGTGAARPPGSKLDLAEIDRYLEGLGKL
jgi:general secretion pathway protein A